ncbi:UDP-N-acetylmuramoyl-L-alanine--D-glutamate ligase [Candidatus Saccharibacteria bacterium HGW-Saccharibacteria-1]|jgi:UDP-N-acetylmuramoylalanine--D-glutamate ligase|nr:MAG: UDP-N-acetylmuramoyl-L-alanine--D-glutamate ligase [Candidatus Saccharibacteria bacterium HGW-Saccharibacteria-1]
MNIAIAGYGIEGESNYKYWSSDKNNHITIFNEVQPERELPVDSNAVIGENAFEKMNGFDLVVRTAGLAPRKIITDGKIWSATNEFFAKCPAKIIGVTGTKGKGTTASLIASIFEAAGKKVWLLGNIGVPSLDSLPIIQPDDIVVYEMSSFQLWDLERSPHVAVVLLIEPDHLNVHDDFDDYVKAKSNIRKYQKAGDLCIFNPTNKYSAQIAKTSNLGEAVRYGIKADGGVYEKDNSFYQSEYKICSTLALQLIGQHNIENACAAITVAKFFELTDDEIESGLQRFKGLPHRIEFVRDLNGVLYYNDSFSSAPSATIAAMKSFDKPEIVVLGGVDKGADFSVLATEIKNRDNIKKVIVIGEIGQKLAKILKDVNSGLDIEVSNAKSLRLIIEQIQLSVLPGDVVLFSPACASFDMFKNFYDRGDQFREIVNNL